MVKCLMYNTDDVLHRMSSCVIVTHKKALLFYGRAYIISVINVVHIY